MHEAYSTLQRNAAVTNAGPWQLEQHCLVPQLAQLEGCHHAEMPSAAAQHLQVPAVPAELRVALTVRADPPAVPAVPAELWLPVAVPMQAVQLAAAAAGLLIPWQPKMVRWRGQALGSVSRCLRQYQRHLQIPETVAQRLHRFESRQWQCLHCQEQWDLAHAEYWAGTRLVQQEEVASVAVPRQMAAGQRPEGLPAAALPLPDRPCQWGPQL